MRIIEYPHPTLRHRSKPLKRVDAELCALVAEMFALMYDAEGVGLAANQVDLPYRLFVMNAKADPEAKDEEFAFINPVISNRRGMAEAEEGCLSLPGLYAPVVRPEKITLNAYTLDGQAVQLELTGFPSRIVQHETDHLDGVLFIDRLSPTNEAEAKESLLGFESAFADRRRRGEAPDDAEIIARIAELEKLRC